MLTRGSQLKNLLLLGECYKRDNLRQYCTRETLKDVFDETVLLLESMPTVEVDKAVLVPLEKLVFGASSPVNLINRLALRNLLVDGTPSLISTHPKMVCIVLPNP